MSSNKVGETVLGKIKGKVVKTVLNPLNEILDDQLSDISTTLGLFAVRNIRGKLQRSITFTIGTRYSDRWMEEALYGILYEYNNIRASSKLELTNKAGISDGSGMYYRLNDGTHNLKYRKYDILLNIQTKTDTSSPFARNNAGVRVYTIITYDLSLDFVKSFERDMLAHRNSLLKIRSDSPTVSIYQDLHENDGYTYWEKTHTIPKRRIGTIYIPQEQKELLVNTINEFFASKAFHNAHGIAHNLKILLYGPPGPQPIDARVPVYGGMYQTKKMGEIEPGDIVYDANGIPTSVEEVYEYPPMEVWTVEFEDGRVVHCADCHKFPVFIHSDKERRTADTVDMAVSAMAQNLTNPDGSRRYSVKRSYPCGFSYDGRDIVPISFEEAFDYGKAYAYHICGVNSEQPYYDIESILSQDANSRRTFLGGIVDVLIEQRLITKTDDCWIIDLEPSKKYEGDIDQFAALIMELGGSLEILNDMEASVEHKTRCKVYPISAIRGDCKGEELFIKAIRNTGELSPMRCLHVASPMHQYLSENYVVTCNSGKDSIAKMIASEWNRNIYYVTGGKNGKYIPNAIVDEGEDVIAPLILISDIDKYPSVITEATVDMKDDKNGAKEDQLQYKQTFGNMINALDGVLSAEGRIVIMTTNHIEKFSDVFRRPGRINLEMEIGYVTPEVFRQYVADFYHRTLPEKFTLKDKDLTVAKMQQEVIYYKLTADEFIAKHVK